MVEITNRSYSGEVKYTDANYEMTGDFRQDPSTNNVTALTLNIHKKEGDYVGYMNCYTENGNLKFNMGQMQLADIAAVATAVNSCLDGIKSETVEP